MGYLTHQLEKLASAVESAVETMNPANQAAPVTQPDGSTIQALIEKIRQKRKQLNEKLEANRLPEGMSLKEWCELTGERPKGLRMN